MNPFNKYTTTLLLILFITACGGGSSSGGDSSSSNEATPILSMTASDGSNPKFIKFNWTATNTSNIAEYKLYENKDGSSGFTPIYTDSIDPTRGSYEHNLSAHLHDWVNATYRLEALDGEGTVLESEEISLPVGLAAEATGYIKALDTEAGDRFGSSIDISGDGSTMAIGAFRNEDSGSNTGAVYIYKQSEGIWAFTLKVTANTKIDNDWFGYSVALSDDGTTLVVGAPLGNDQVGGIGTGNSTNTGATDAGAVYVYTLAADGTSRSNQVYIKASTPASYRRFGHDVALVDIGSNWGSGLALAVSAYDSSTNSPGSVYIFERSGDSWSEKAIVTAHNADNGDAFGLGLDLAIDDNIMRLAVAAPLEDSAYEGVFGPTEFNGQAVDNSRGDSGAIYIYSYDLSVLNDTWSQTAFIGYASSQNIRLPVALSATGNTLAVSQSDLLDGSITIYQSSSASSQYSVASALTDDLEGASYDRFENIALSGDGSVLTASLDNPTGEGVYVFTRNNSGAYEQTNFINGFDDFDYFGYALELSHDGSTLAIGSEREGGSSTGIDGAVNNNAADAGAVYIH